MSLFLENIINLQQTPLMTLSLALFVFVLNEIGGKLVDGIIG